MNKTKIRGMAEFEKFRPARIYRNGDNWEIHYYAFNPVINDVERKRMRINNAIKYLSTDRKKQQYANSVIISINKKLQQGWSPFINEEVHKGYMLLKNALEFFVNDKKQEGLRKDTIRSYESYTNQLIEWLKTQHVYDSMFIISFKRLDAISFMNFLFREKKVSNRTYNNYLAFCIGLWNWLMMQEYITFNPFDKIPRKKNEKKQRTFINNKQRTAISAFLKTEKPEFRLPCYLAYWALVRRTEITKLMVKHIDFVNQCIRIPGSITKNGNPRDIAMSKELWNLVVELQLDKYPKWYYIFGKNFKPGTTSTSPKTISDYWGRHVKKKCKLPSNVHFYSLRDTGIRRLLELGVAPHKVAEHADHHDLNITSTYAIHLKPKGVREITKLDDNF